MDVVRGSAPSLSLSGDADLFDWISRNEARRDFEHVRTSIR